MTILALDLGSSTGYAYRTRAGNVFSGVESFEKKTTEGARLRRLYCWLASMKGEGFDAIVYEQPRGVFIQGRGGLQSQHLFSQFEAIVLLYCESNDVPSVAVNPNTLKKRATGSGKAEKGAIVQAVRSLGYDVTNHNQADALALLLTHTGELKAEPPPKPKRARSPRSPPGRNLFEEQEKPF